MTEANKFLDKQSEGYDEVKIHETLCLPKIKVQSLMKNFADEQVEKECKSFALWLESKEFDGRSINEYWNEYNETF